jgi:hypothetical protein
MLWSNTNEYRRCDGSKHPDCLVYQGHEQFNTDALAEEMIPRKWNHLFLIGRISDGELDPLRRKMFSRQVLPAVIPHDRA